MSLFAFVFLVMLPAKLAALDAGLSEAEAVQRSWQVGLMACLGSGVIETLGAFVAHSLRRWLPRAVAVRSSSVGIECDPPTARIIPLDRRRHVDYSGW